jgi:GntR family transcriptional regulator
MERIRLADDRPLALMRNWVVTDLGDGIDIDRLANESLYAVIRSAGIQPYRARQRIGAVAAGVELATLLDVSIGAPLITVQRVMSDDTGRPIEVGEHHIAAERHSMEMTLIET